MPTIVTRTIGTSRDYSSLQAWSDAAPLDLTTTRSNTCGSGSTTSAVVLDSGANSTTNDFYKSLTITIAGEERLILSYVAATRTATIGSLNGSAATFTSAPSSGVAYTINDVIWKGILYKEGAGTNGEWTLSARVTCYGANHTTDATRYIWLTAAPGASFSDNPNKLTNALAYNAANGVAVRMTGTEKVFELANGITFRFTGLQIQGKTAQPLYAFNAGGLVTVENCIVYMPDANEAVYLPQARYVNSLFYSAALVVTCTADSSFYASTLYTTSTTTPVINTVGAGALIYDCAFFGGNAVSSSTSFMTASNNATNQASVGFGTANQVGLTAASQFQSVTPGSEDFRVRTGAALINNGIRQQVYTSDLDIVGSARSTTTPTIGAWEFGAITYTYARPTSDITTQWTPSTGTDHFALIDETTANDADYIFATAGGQTDEVKLAAMTAPKSGTSVDVQYRVQGVSGGGKVTLSLVCNTTVIATDAIRSFDGDYVLTVAPATWAAVTDWSNMRLRFVSSI